jgi:hypothetical protein
MSPGESKFREIEQGLDRAVRKSEAQILALGVTAQDRSLRQHQRGEYLSWCFEFTKSWELDLETARVRVSLSYQEPVDASDDAEVRVWRCAEQFRPGQLSRIRQVAERALPVHAFTGSKLGEIVVLEMRGGAHVLDQAL